MAALGRILQVVGWLWVILGFAGSFFDFLEFGFLPGIILLFIARVIRSQAERREMPDLERAETSQEAEPQAPPRMMNTERQRLDQHARPQPAVIEPAPAPDTTERAPRKRNQLLDQIVTAGREVGADEDIATQAETDRVEAVDVPEVTKPLSSAEMIARARKRWDAKPR